MLVEGEDLQGGGVVPVEHHGRQQAAGAGGHRRRPAAQDSGEPQQGRVPDAEGGGLGRVQPQHQRHARAGRRAHTVRRHPALLQPAGLQGHAGHQCELELI